jgi:hypothetical protein
VRRAQISRTVQSPDYYFQIMFVNEFSDGMQIDQVLLR